MANERQRLAMGEPRLASITAATHRSVQELPTICCQSGNYRTETRKPFRRLRGVLCRARFANCRIPNAAVAVPALCPRRRVVIAALLNQKGGVGKTTLALHVAGARTA
jgi:hypothetical protein